MKTTTLTEKAQALALILRHLALVLAVALFGTAAILYSTAPAQAEDGPQMTNGVGKYQMALTAISNSDKKTFWYVLVWDTETGRSKFYY